MAYDEREPSNAGVSSKLKAGDFASRLKRAMDGHPRVPPGHGRQKWLQDELAAQLKISVSPEAVRKWYHGEARPRPAMLEDIARVLKVDPAWLAVGSTPLETKAHSVERRATAAGATNALAGLIQMAGGHISFPEDDENYDLLAIIDGKAHRIEIKLAHEAGGGTRAIAVDPRFEKHVVILVERTDSPLAIKAWRVPTEYLVERGTYHGGHVEAAIDERRLREIVDLGDLNGRAAR